MTTASAWAGVVFLILFVGLMAGFWAGIVGLWRARRGAAWWLMAVGIALLTIGPLLYGLGMWTVFDSIRSGGPSSSALSAGPTIILMAASLLIPVGLLLFSVGFAIHGFAAARTVNRAEELEQLTAAMSEEINRMREGGPAA